MDVSSEKQNKAALLKLNQAYWYQKILRFHSFTV